MTLIYVNDEKTTIESLCAMIDKAPKMDVFKLEEVASDGSKGDIIVLSKVLREHPCLEAFNMTSVTLTDASLSLDQTVSIILVTVPDLSHVKLERVPVTSSALARFVSPSALAAAGYCTSLTTPIAPKSGLTHKDSIKLAETVSQSPSIQLSDIPDNDLSDLGCDTFATVVDRNSSINLEGDGKISGKQRTPIATTLLARAGGNAHAA
jgi:hypothetical protein